MNQGRLEFWSLLAPGWLLFVYLVYAQAIPAFDYQLGVAMGTQEPASRISEVGVGFFRGFAFADLVIYLPLLAAGLVGQWLGKHWGRIVLAAALGITVYWPIVCLAAVVASRGTPGWNLGNEAAYWIVLPLTAAWALWGLLYIAHRPLTSGAT